MAHHNISNIGEHGYLTHISHRISTVGTVKRIVMGCIPRRSVFMTPTQGKAVRYADCCGSLESTPGIRSNCDCGACL